MPKTRKQVVLVATTYRPGIIKKPYVQNAVLRKTQNKISDSVFDE